MRLLYVLRCALSVCVLASVACALRPVALSENPATYAIRIHRTQKAGDRGIVSTVVRSKRTMIMEEGDQIVKREEEGQEVELKAVVNVLRVDAAGEPLDLEYAIESLSVQTPAGRTEV